MILKLDTYTMPSSTQDIKQQGDLVFVRPSGHKNFQGHVQGLIH